MKNARHRLPTGLLETLSARREAEDPGMLTMPEPAASGQRRGAFKPSDRLTGLLLGCAIGDALGMPVEGVENDEILRAIHRLGGIRDYLAPQPHVLRSLRRLRPGCWTDDTQLTLAITRSLVRERGVDHDAVASAHVHAFENFELRGWDATTKQSCRRLAQGTPRTRSGKLGGAANAVAAKIAPIAAVSHLRGEDRASLLDHCCAVSVMTHHDPRSAVGAYLVGLLVQDALDAPRRWEPEADRYESLMEEAAWAESELAGTIGTTDEPISQHLSELSDALDSDADELAELSHGATHHAWASIPFIIALLASRPWEFEGGVLATVNAGGDTDTNGAIVGSILGAACGARRIPRRFVDKLEEAEMIRELGHEFAVSVDFS